MDIDWTNPEDQVSEHFTVKECLYLPTWKRMAVTEDGLTPQILTAIAGFCQVLEKVRDFLGMPMNVHCMYRPPEYSVLVGGNREDVHTQGIAIDFDCNPILSCDEVKARLSPQLEAFGIRMEDNGAGKGWVHLDSHPVIHARYFKA